MTVNQFRALRSEITEIEDICAQLKEGNTQLVHENLQLREMVVDLGGDVSIVPIAAQPFKSYQNGD